VDNTLNAPTVMVEQILAAFLLFIGAMLIVPLIVALLPATTAALL